MEKNINEGIIDLDSLGSSSEITLDSLVKTKKKKKKIELLEPEQQAVVQTPIPTELVPEVIIQEPIIPESLVTHQQKIFVDSVINNTQQVQQQQRLKLGSQQIIENQQLISDIQEKTGVELPENFDALELKVELESAAQEIPNGEDLSMEDFEIKVSEKKDKTGYHKVKVNLKKDGIPESINSIASKVKKLTGGLIFPRIMDFRVIGNTNKTQLKSAALKLNAISIVFKPDFQKLHVNKGTRIALSIPEDHNSTGNFIVYMQESRSKSIFEITRKDFDTQEHFEDFVSNRICDFYQLGYTVTKQKFSIVKNGNPIMDIITKLVKSKEFKVKPYIDESTDNIIAFDVITTGDKNQWLYFNVMESNKPAQYDITALNKVDSGWRMEINSKTPITISYLREKIYDFLVKQFDKDWKLEESDDKDFYILGKITYRKFRSAVMDIMENREDKTELEIFIKEALSQQQTQKILNKEYGAEVVIGKTKALDYFILTYLAYQVVGGDKRNGKQYITRQQYYQKYSVKDRRDYQERQKTILKKEGTDRNYNSRPYIFQLEYSIGGKKCIYRNADWNLIKEETGFLSENPIDASMKSI